MVIILCKIKENNNSELGVEKQTRSKDLSQPQSKGKSPTGNEDA